MKLKLKAGDRVRLRGTKDKGVIAKLSAASSYVCVKWDKNGVTSSTLEESLIRLKPKRRREIWVAEFKDGLDDTAFKDKNAPEDIYHCSKGFIRAVRFLEAKDGK